ncbi:MAG: cyclic nucleotide-binding domain-containing protein [Beijerinckiaceae bacterium]|nr:cyclic nucleotide-binding domain-containing protein [Beijerinckiaceae bacterium]
MGLEEDIGTLARNPTFAVFEPEALRLIAFSAEIRTLRAGDILFRRDEISNGGYLVLTGSIAIDPSGIGAATARIVRPPGFIGDLAILTQTRRPATAIAREPTNVMQVSRQLFHRVLHEFPESAERLRRSLGARLLEFTGELRRVRRTRLTPEGGEPAA